MRLYLERSTSGLHVILLLLVVATRTNGECSDDQWECDNGDCINFDERCDGTTQCKDTSDEIAANCIHQKCPEYAFRCAYGACVRSDARCDGRIDCADKSDELQRICGNHTEFENAIRGDCGAQQMQCTPGTCIDIGLTCDGIEDCYNGADESVDLCGFTKCPTGAFQCGYGACLDADVYCNSTVECLDGSDESFELCGYRRSVYFKVYHYGGYGGGSSAGGPVPSDTCDLPTYYPHLIISDLQGKPLTGEVKKGTIVRFSCSEDYTLSNTEVQSSFCIGPYFNQLNSCERPCNTSVIVKDFTKSATCQHFRHIYNCEEANSVRPGTSAIIQCATYFYPPSIRTKLEEHFCTKEGDWEKSELQCTMHCGTTVQTFPLAANAIDVSNSEMPWHVGIYTSVNERTFNYTCGGTIISPLLVLTAAHCVFDVVDGAARPAYSFQIIASKFYKDYYHTESGSQIRNVSKIIVHNDYKHFDVFQNDLALFVLERHLKFGRTIRPICFDHTVEQSISYGKLGAWGLSENVKFSKREVLQVVSGQHYDYGKCRELRPTEVLTSDKYCVKSIIGLACRGDSGGGYFVHNPKTNLYYLKGVLSSASETDTDGCANSETLLYVIDVYQFRNWIYKRQLIEENNYISGTIVATSNLMTVTPTKLAKTLTLAVSAPATERKTIKQIIINNTDFVFPDHSEEDAKPNPNWIDQRWDFLEYKYVPPNATVTSRINAESNSKDFVYPLHD